jgi:hypothetical protein
MVFFCTYLYVILTVWSRWESPRFLMLVPVRKCGKVSVPYWLSLRIVMLDSMGILVENWSIWSPKSEMLFGFGPNNDKVPNLTFMRCCKLGHEARFTREARALE